ncbi:MAG TPA: small multi-drug export protein [Phnomibacter sp.]|nr:small multi-drug export protein [Phnomibacter sp.]
MFFKTLTVASLATFEIYAAIPAGFAFGLSPWTIFLASVTGGLTGVFVAAFLGDKVRAFFKRKGPAKEDAAKKYPIIAGLWEKYGIIGLGFLGTISVGAPITLAIGLGLNANIKPLVTWCCLGVMTRCIVFTWVGWYGLQLI